MFDVMIKIMIYATWVGIIITPIALLGLRIYYFFTSKDVLKTRLLVLLLPFSLGFEYFVPTSNLKKIYRIAVIICFVLLLIGSFFMFYMYKSN